MERVALMPRVLALRLLLIFLFSIIATFHVAPPCVYVHSVGAESECFCWILRENHFSLIAVGSERERVFALTRTGPRRAKLLRHDELAPMEIHANEVGYLSFRDCLPFSCEFEIRRLVPGLRCIL